MNLHEFLIENNFQQVTQTTETSATVQCVFGENHKGGVDHHPSASIFLGKEDKYWYFCHSCGAKGLLENILQGKADLSGLKTTNPHVVFQGLNTFDEGLDGFCSIEEYQEGLDYCFSRGISAKTLQKLNVLASPDLRKIIIPTYYDGKIVGLNHRDAHDEHDPDSSYEFPKAGTIAGTNKAYTLGFESLLKHESVIIVEGTFDYLACIEKGLDEQYAIIALCGANLSSDTVNLFGVCGIKEVIFFTDNDFAGYKVYLEKTRAENLIKLGGFDALVAKSSKAHKQVKLKKDLKNFKLFDSVYAFDYNKYVQSLNETQVSILKDPCDVLISKHFKIDDFRQYLFGLEAS